MATRLRILDEFPHLVEWFKSMAKPRKGPPMRYIDREGRPVDREKCVTPDHFKTIYILKVRSTDANITERLRDVIQTKFEVTHLEETDSVCVVR
jgi:hypothetical protein